jgi:predicted RNA-binding Zn-ribbon protein involved in translation (DUF1610 family)
MKPMQNPTPASGKPSHDQSAKHRTRQACPRCGHSIHRSHRRPLDRVASLVVPLQRFRCSECGWSGLHVSSSGRPLSVALTKNTTRLALIVAALVLSVAAAVMITLVRFPVR